MEIRTFFRKSFQKRDIWNTRHFRDMIDKSFNEAYIICIDYECLQLMKCHFTKCLSMTPLEMSSGAVTGFQSGGGEIFQEQNFSQELGTKFKKKGTKPTQYKKSREARLNVSRAQPAKNFCPPLSDFCPPLGRFSQVFVPHFVLFVLQPASR